MIAIAAGLIPFSVLSGKQPVACQEYHAKYWLKGTPGKHG